MHVPVVIPSGSFVRSWPAKTSPSTASRSGQDGRSNTYRRSSTKPSSQPRTTLAMLFACFGRHRDLTLFDDSFLDEMRDTAHLDPSERVAIAVELSRVATQLAATARPQG
jgi:hypothetical protein